jgi:D-alanyl-D-alanine carboxypeptidase
MTLSRREFVAAAAAGSVLVADWIEAAPAAPAADVRYAGAFRAIDDMVARYMREMNAPGLTLAIADRDAVLRVATYGLSDGISDAGRREPVRPEHLFHIGSISKSFAAIALLQLRDEGKLDPHAPVTRYLPWLRIEPREITTHHLLSHSSGLPDSLQVFPSDPDATHTAGFTPGAHFHYSNLGYGVLGLLVETLDDRPYPEVIRARILKPLGMNASAPSISADIRERTAASYNNYLDDRPYTRHGRLGHAPAIVLDNAAGCIASTPADMGLYLRMLARRGAPLLGEQSFAEMSTRHIKLADEGEPGYGYGLFTDTLDEHPVIRHTGGMVSFMSAMHIDLTDGIGAFASVNAQQGYRPNPVTTYAIRAIRAANANKPMPDPPPPNSPATIKGAGDLAGVYTSNDGAKIELAANGDALFLVHGGKRLPVEIAGGELYVNHPDFALFPFFFEREKKDGGRAISVGHGPRWWTVENYAEPRTFDVPDAWRGYEGHYRSEDPWVGSGRIVLRQGKLWVNGTAPLRAVNSNTFRFAEPEYNPEWIQFLQIVNGKARHMKVSGTDLYRVEVR